MEREELQEIVDEVISKEPDALVQIQHNPNDTNSIVNFLVGKVMQKTRGQADPVLTLQMIRERI